MILNFFIFITLFSAFFLVWAKTPIHSIFFLILTFFSSSIILLILHLEFLAMLFLIVYVGAVAVLFLFVVMMLTIKNVQLFFNSFIPLGFFILLLLFFQIFYFYNNLILENSIVYNFSELSNSYYNSYIINLDNYTNIQQIAEILYTKYRVFFLISSLLLLNAMIAAILLTLKHENLSYRQNYYVQNNRKFENSIFLKK